VEKNWGQSYNDNCNYNYYYFHCNELHRGSLKVDFMPENALGYLLCGKISHHWLRNSPSCPVQDPILLHRQRCCWLERFLKARRNYLFFQTLATRGVVIFYSAGFVTHHLIPGGPTGLNLALSGPFICKCNEKNNLAFKKWALANSGVDSECRDGRLRVMRSNHAMLHSG
jgi:hypothetical protein